MNDKTTCCFKRVVIPSFDEMVTDLVRLEEEMKVAGKWHEGITISDIMDFAGTRVILNDTEGEK